MDPQPIDPYTAAAFWALFLGIWIVTFAFIFIVFAALYVVTALALSRLFAKVGVEPWIAWVPIYSTWKWLELGGFPGWVAILSVIPYANLVTSVFLWIGMYRTGLAFRKGGEWVVLGIFLPVVWAFLLARPTETYEPQLITQAGYPPPLVGHGSAFGPRA